MCVAGVWAQGPKSQPRTEGSIKSMATVDLPDLFAQQRKLIHARRSTWLDKARGATPKLHRRIVHPQALIKVIPSKQHFQGWATSFTAQPDTLCDRPLKTGDSFILDFGTHLTGYLELSLKRISIPVDAPVRLELIFGEVPAEVIEPFDPYPGTLTRAWLQDEVVNIDVVPQTLRLPRRYAFRYVKITVVSCSAYGKFGFSNIQAEAITSANETSLAPAAFTDPMDQALDQISLRTLRNCMQTVFEDGPKRDRRLWLGDLRLQAQANYVTYQQNDLVKRCLYVLAGTAKDKGLVATNVFEHPQPVRGGDTILDYTALFAPTVLDYLQATGDKATALDLWPLVLKQLDFTLEPVDPQGLFHPMKGWWLFVDWQQALDKQASEQAILLYGLKATQSLGQALGRRSEVAFVDALVRRMEQAAWQKLWDESQGLFVSGPDAQVSWSSQTWMVLAGLLTEAQGRNCLRRVMAHPQAVKPVSPYMHHHVVEALFQAGLKQEATDYLHHYWGGMVKKGADTFWEVYVPEDEYLSPYKCHLMNSYCHAWSCTPSYFLRR